MDIIRHAQVHVSDTSPELTAERWINLTELRSDDVRILRHAINGLTATADIRAIADVVRLARYSPSLTPNLMLYLESVGNRDEMTDDERRLLADTIDALWVDVTLNAWQQIWLIDAMHNLALLKKDASSLDSVKHRVDWVNGLRKETANEALRAVATRALAAHAHIPLTDIIADADRNSDALLPIYASAAHECTNQLSGSAAQDGKRTMHAWAGTSKFHSLLLQV